MDREQILAMRPGTEMNAMVAAEIIGHAIANDETFGWMERWISPDDGGSIWAPPQPYSEDMEAVERVVDCMIELGHDDAVCWADFGGGKYTEAEAICKAALCAKLERCSGAVA